MVRSSVELDTPSASLAIVKLVGELDLATDGLLRDMLYLASTRRRHVIVDLSECDFIDSTAVTRLLLAQGEVVSDGGHFGLVLPACAGPVGRAADVMSFTSLFPVYETLEAACKAGNVPAGRFLKDFREPLVRVPAGSEYLPA